MLIQSIISTSFHSVPGIPTTIPSLGVPTSVLTSHPDYSIGFFRRDYDSGYFGDDVTWFALQTPSYSDWDGYINIGTSLNDLNIDNYSIQWTGYFIPPTNGNYMFRTTSDDASYLWLGAEALSGFTTGNAVVNNGGAHGDQTVASTSQYTMHTNTAYPIRVQYGEAGGGATMYAEYSSDGGITWNHFINNCFRISSTSEGYLPYQSAYPVFALEGSSYTSGDWVDSIGNRSFTLYNNPTWSSTNGGQLRFDKNSSQYGDCSSSIPSLSSFTIQGVFKIHSISALGACLITEQWPAITHINFAIGFINNTDNIAAGFFSQNEGFWNTANAVLSPGTNTWYDVVMSFYAPTKELKVYLDGQLFADTVVPGSALSDGQGLRIARRWDNADYFDCTIKDINIWKGVLTDNEVISQHLPYNSLT